MSDRTRKAGVKAVIAVWKGLAASGESMAQRGSGRWVAVPVSVPGDIADRPASISLRGAVTGSGPSALASMFDGIDGSGVGTPQTPIAVHAWPPW